MEHLLLEKVIRNLTVTLKNVSVKQHNKKRDGTQSLFHQLIITHNKEMFSKKKEFWVNDIYFIPSGCTTSLETLYLERTKKQSKWRMVATEITEGNKPSYNLPTHAIVLEFAAMTHGGIDFVELAKLKPFILKKNAKVVFPLEMIMQEYENQKLGAKSISDCAMHVLFILLLRYMVDNKVLQPIDRKRISSLMNHRLVSIFMYVMDNLCGNLSNSAIAKAVNLSSEYTAELFKKVTGETLQNYVRVKRINKARVLLMTTEKKIREVASKVGFDDASYFCRVFKRKTGHSPNDFREACKDIP